MRSRASAALVCLVVLAADPARAVEVLQSAFQTTFTYAGTEQRLDDHVVPLVPGDACYTWWLQLPKDSKPLSVTERLVLPAAPAGWGDAATDSDDGIEIEDEGKVAVSTFAPELDSEGWMHKGWCISEGDPVGHHRIEVTLDGALLTTYDFEVVKPEDYAWPAIRQPDPNERSVDQSW